MFPLRDDNPTLRASLFTFLIVGLNVAAWVYYQGFGFNPYLIKSICNFGLIPGELLGILPKGTMIPVGQGYACVLDGNPNWITVVTSMFMHGSWFHLISNMWFLLVFGDNVEDALGHFRFVIFYLLCGITAEAAQILTNPSSAIPMVGASGAISGVMGAYAVMFPRAPVHVLVFFVLFFRVVMPAALMLGYWFLIQVLSGLPTLGGETGGVAFWAHIGGFAAGVILSKIMCDPKRVNLCKKKRGNTNSLVKRYTFSDDFSEK